MSDTWAGLADDFATARTRRVRTYVMHQQLLEQLLRMPVITRSPSSS